MPETVEKMFLNMEPHETIFFRPFKEKTISKVQMSGKIRQVVFINKTLKCTDYQITEYIFHSLSMTFYIYILISTGLIDLHLEITYLYIT